MASPNIDGMDVRIFPNSSRPGVGMRPRREGSRPLLPQHARHCPVLEAGSALGFLVYPPLEPNESFHIEYQGEGRFQFMYFMNTPAGKWESVFAMAMQLPVGSVGMIKEEVSFLIKDPPINEENAKLMARSFIVPEDMGTPPGAVSLRGATNFKTPEGWDTVYTPIFNMIERPVAPMLIVRVETDWYPHETEFRYVLQPGEGLPGAHQMPIGQVFFVPREEVTLIDCTPDEIAVIHKTSEEFFKHKAASKISTPYGLQYSPHYLRESRARKT